MVHQYVPTWYTNTIITLIWLFAVVFLVTYTADAIVFHVKNPWWRTNMGQNLFWLPFTLALTLSPYMLREYAGVSITSSFYQWWVAVALTLVIPVEVHRIGYAMWLRWQDLTSERKSSRDALDRARKDRDSTPSS